MKGQVTGRLLISDYPPAENIVASYGKYDTGGNTSVANEIENSFKWSGESPFKSESWGYFRPDSTEVPYIKRDRDLGQTFILPDAGKKQLISVTVRLGFGTNVVRSEMYGNDVSIQFFEVSGNPVLNNNGSDDTTEAFHGFPHNRRGDIIDHRRDDYLDCEIFKSIAVIRGFRFPWKKDLGITADSASLSPDDQRLKGRFLQFRLPDHINIPLESGKTYAFLIMIDNAGTNKGFTLANNYSGSYEYGHAIRRDGNGVFPPSPANPLKDFPDPSNHEALAAAHFPFDFENRITISPGTNGYPDVDTWRDLVFYIEAKALPDTLIINSPDEKIKICNYWLRILVAIPAGWLEGTARGGMRGSL